MDIVELKVHFSLVIDTAMKYKIDWLCLEFDPRFCEGNHIPSYVDMDDGTIFQFFFQRCIGNTIYSWLIISRVVPGLLCETDTTDKYIILLLSFKFHPQICKGICMSLSKYINDFMIFWYSIQMCTDNIMHNLV